MHISITIKHILNTRLQLLLQSMCIKITIERILNTGL